MAKNDSILSIRGFGQHTIFSQTSSLISLTVFNFLDVAKIRLIKDPKLCSVEHFNAKSARISFLESAFIKSDFTQKCLDCLPTRNSIKSL